MGCSFSKKQPDVKNSTLVSSRPAGLSSINPRPGAVYRDYEDENIKNQPQYFSESNSILGDTNNRNGRGASVDPRPDSIYHYHQNENNSRSEPAFFSDTNPAASDAVTKGPGTRTNRVSFVDGSNSTYNDSRSYVKNSTSFDVESAVTVTGNEQRRLTVQKSVSFISDASIKLISYDDFLSLGKLPYSVSDLLSIVERMNIGKSAVDVKKVDGGASQSSLKRLSMKLDVLKRQGVNESALDKPAVKASIKEAVEIMQNAVTVSSDDIDMDEAFVVYVSHNWLNNLAADPNGKFATKRVSEGGPETKVENPNIRVMDYKSHFFSDDYSNAKYKLILSGVQQTWKVLAPKLTRCYIYIDCICAPVRDLVVIPPHLSSESEVSSTWNSYATLMRLADVVFTPIIDRQSGTWDLPTSEDLIANRMIKLAESLKHDDRGSGRARIRNEQSIGRIVDTNENSKSVRALSGSIKKPGVDMRSFLLPPKPPIDAARHDPNVSLDDVECEVNLFDHYQAALWNAPGHNSYVNRAWCRFDMLSAATFPLDASKTLTPRLKSLPPGYLKLVLAGRRPHLIYGTREATLCCPPLIMQKVQNFSYDYVDVENGYFSRDMDVTLCRRLVQNLRVVVKKMLLQQSGNEHHAQKENEVSLESSVKAEYAEEKAIKLARNLDEFEASRSVFKNESGDMYQGDWRDGEMGIKHGAGVYVYNDGDIYKGLFKNDKKDGHGEYRYADGNVYRGEWREDHMHGDGVLEFASGAVYKGHFLNDTMHGTGSYSYSNGDSYSGHFQLDCFEGVGTFVSSDISLYSSENDHGNRIMPGVYRFTATFIYEGDWKAGKKCGFGVSKHISGDRYEGQWIDDKKEGLGRLQCADGSEYDGQWRKDKRHGKGVFKGSDGSVYEGGWYDDKRDGFGIFKAVGGQIYEGLWEADQMHGQGKTWTQGIVYDGDVEEGVWFEGQRVPQAEY